MTSQNYKIVLQKGARTFEIIVDHQVANDRFIGLVDGVEIAVAEEPSKVMAIMLAKFGRAGL
ncbi:MAG: hypothetical protein EON58_05740 [Alphaproteobacteria bacterium]|nr:MAG: hypothetical protein EON58_05740 [Alphaproteobacteria bacterium]